MPSEAGAASPEGALAPSEALTGLPDLGPSAPQLEASPPAAEMAGMGPNLASMPALAPESSILSMPSWMNTSQDSVPQVLLRTLIS